MKNLPRINADPRRSAFIRGSISVSDGAFDKEFVYNLAVPESNTSMLTKAIQNHGATLKRGTGLLLAFFILYGTTVEAAHRHGSVLPSGSTATSLTGTQHSSAPAGSKFGCNDCLICQLHQHFNTTLIAFRVADPPARIRVNIPVALPRDVLSRITGPTAGRAPPFIS